MWCAHQLTLRHAANRADCLACVFMLFYVTLLITIGIANNYSSSLLLLS